MIDPNLERFPQFTSTVLSASMALILSVFNEDGIYLFFRTLPPALLYTQSYTLTPTNT